MLSLKSICKYITKSQVLWAIFLIFIAITTPVISSAHAEEDIFYYAKVESDNVYFYSSPAENGQRLFEIPNTYFVKLIGDENQTFYLAEYSDMVGYVKKSEVTAMDGTPANPYATSNFRIFSLEGIGLYSSPSLNEDNRIANIPYLAENLVYYGRIEGEETIPDKSDIWYYCRYNDTLDYGYVYSVFCDQLTDFVSNNEYFDVVEPSFESPSGLSGLSPVAMTFIVIGVSLPCIVVIYLLIKPTLLKDKVLNNHPKVHKKRHGDYYEFDESDLN